MTMGGPRPTQSVQAASASAIHPSIKRHQSSQIELVVSNRHVTAAGRPPTARSLAWRWPAPCRGTCSGGLYTETVSIVLPFWRCERGLWLKHAQSINMACAVLAVVLQHRSNKNFGSTYYLAKNHRPGTCIFSNIRDRIQTWSSAMDTKRRTEDMK